MSEFEFAFDSLKKVPELISGWIENHGDRKGSGPLQGMTVDFPSTILVAGIQQVLDLKRAFHAVILAHAHHLPETKRATFGTRPFKSRSS